MADTYTPRLKTRFREEIVPQLRQDLGLTNVMQVPRLDKIVVNMGVGDAIQDQKLLDAAVNELGQITGQRPSRTST